VSLIVQRALEKRAQRRSAGNPLSVPDLAPTLLVVTILFSNLPLSHLRPPVETARAKAGPSALENRLHCICNL
jgi:hypothetical protein